ncbi:uncharacterized protein DS421_13g430910 [Arachis hypogaea]|nr:uncharacterized protein DS421_13g430910 [Arachis hypogaea]
MQNRHPKMRKRKKNTQTGDHTFIHKEKMRGRLFGPSKTNPVFWTRDYQLILWLVLLRSTNPVVSTKMSNKLSIDQGFLP